MSLRKLEQMVNHTRKRHDHKAQEYSLQRCPPPTSHETLGVKITPCLVPKIKIPIFFPAPTWRLKSRRNKNRIATAACKWRDESNETN